MDVVHTGIICDVTNTAGDFTNPIRGPRYHLVGADYDVCHAAFMRLPECDKRRFEVIAHPGATPVRYTSAAPASAPAPAPAPAPSPRHLSPSTSFREHVFEQKLQKALQKVGTILDNTRNPKLAADVHHGYEDKFALAEHLASCALASALNALGALGLDDGKLAAARAWALEDKAKVTLSFESEERCRFLREETRNVESKTKHKTKTSRMGGLLGDSETTTTHSVVTEVTEYFYEFTADLRVVLTKGDGSDRLELRSRSGRFEIKTTTKKPPRPASAPVNTYSLDLTPLLKTLSGPEGKIEFAIDRDSSECRTPYRNPEIGGAVEFFLRLGQFSHEVTRYFKQKLWSHPITGGPRTDDTAPKPVLDFTAEDIFVPILPLFEEPRDEEEAPEAEDVDSRIARLSANPSRFTFNLGEANQFLSAQKDSLGAAIDRISRSYPDAGAASGLVTRWEGEVLTCLAHMTDIMEQYSQSAVYIEEMLRKQLLAAVGREITPQDFDKYMAFHDARLYQKEYAPSLFSYAVRRPEHYPEGVISIENSGSKEPIKSISRHIPAIDATPMSFKINAGTDVTFTGDRYLHAYVSYKFRDSRRNSGLSLEAHARQFSSYMVLLGRIGSADTFEPKHAVILRNKDSLSIPLMLEQLPTPKEFKDAIESLSPEQQRFAKAYRAMQLEGTVFGVLVIQLKPQLEKLLNLPDRSLTKKIKLTEDLMTLFTEYQIPSDLLSFEGDTHAELDTKIAKVEEHVKDIQEMLGLVKEDEKADAKHHYEMERCAELAEHQDSDMVFMSAPPEPVLYKSAARRGGGGGGFGGRGRGRHQNMHGMMAPMSAQPMAMAMSAPMPESNMRTSRGAGPPRKKSAAKKLAKKSSRAPPSSSSQQQQQQPDPSQASIPGESESEGGGIDFTKVPSQLDKSFEELDTDSALRPTIINVGERWRKQYKKTLLGESLTENLGSGEQSEEKKKAFDLLDALSKSGTLEIECASLHVIVAATHCFDDTVVDTVVKRSVNPIEKVERSSLIVSQIIQGRGAGELLRPESVGQIRDHSPQLMGGAIGSA